MSKMCKDRIPFKFFNLKVRGPYTHNVSLTQCLTKSERNVTLYLYRSCPAPGLGESSVISGKSSHNEESDPS